MTNGTRSNSGSGLRILVVGAGIAGLGAARALRQRGFAPDVVERESAWAPTGAGIYLPGNTARALRALGLESAVIERAAPIPHQRICDHHGNLLTDIDVATMWRDVGPASPCTVPTCTKSWHSTVIPCQSGWVYRRGRSGSMTGL